MQRIYNQVPIKFEELYIVRNAKVDHFIKEASIYFNLFILDQKKDEVFAAHAIKMSIKFYNMAINEARQNSTLTDSAFSNRKYATAIIRDESIALNVRYKDAMEHLQYSIRQYEQFLKDQRQNISEKYVRKIILEIERALALLSHVALTLKNGKLLEEATKNLVEKLKEVPNPHFELEALTNLFQINLSNKNIDEALVNIKALQSLAEQHKLFNPTDFRLYAKINLLKISDLNEQKGNYFFKEIQDVFWNSFDAHKKLLFSINPNAWFSNYKHIKFLLRKDFHTLLHIKVVQCLNNIPDKDSDNNSKETIYEYIIRQIKTVYHPLSLTGRLISAELRENITKIKENGMIKIGHDLFDDRKPPSISVSKEEFTKLFPEYEKLVTMETRENINNMEKNNNDKEEVEIVRSNQF